MSTIRAARGRAAGARSRVRRTASCLALAAALLLSGCGFQLRGPAGLPFDTLYIQAPPASLFATQVRRVVSASSNTQVVQDPKAAQATLQLIDERREKEILSLSGTGRVREFQLRYRVLFRVVDRNQRELVPVSEIVLRRDFSFNDQEALSKESEEAFLFRDMQADAVQQLLRRLQATKTAPA